MCCLWNFHPWVFWLLTLEFARGATQFCRVSRCRSETLFSLGFLRVKGTNVKVPGGGGGFQKSISRILSGITHWAFQYYKAVLSIKLWNYGIIFWRVHLQCDFMKQDFQRGIWRKQKIGLTVLMQSEDDLIPKCWPWMWTLDSKVIFIDNWHWW